MLVSPLPISLRKYIADAYKERVVPRKVETILINAPVSLAEEFKDCAVFIDSDVEKVEELRRRGAVAIFMACVHEDILLEAGIDKARKIIIFKPSEELVALIKALNLDAHIVAVASDLKEKELLTPLGCDKIIRVDELVKRKIISYK